MLDLPMPNAKELDKFVALYRENFGTEPSRDDAHDAFCRLIHLIYLTEYHPVRPLSKGDPEMMLSPSKYQEAKVRRQYRERIKATRQVPIGTGVSPVGSATPLR